IGRETAVGIDTGSREAAAREKLALERQRLEELEGRWKREKALVDQILEIRGRLRAGGHRIEGTASALGRAAEAEAQSAAGAGSQAAGGAPALSPEERAALLEKLRKLQGELH